MHTLRLSLTLLLGAAAAGPALAGPALDAAQSHFAAIGAGERGAIMKDYGEQARLLWIGGPLDGSYAGTEAIGAVWDKFTAAAGPAKVSVGSITESVNPKGATVSAAVQFEGKVAVKVRYVLSYRDGKLVQETWQVDPQLVLAAH